ncbi:heavy-metal-associated domain-containing protein [Winogradskyella echinorum]|uniref:Heavy-metal-associated domain-containing protein n=1 Tax=Winogradskyella echinorum TaxID=538189 RepID=A0ABR6XZK6_9FLAO|nr:heavy metal-associated domain-containing protein [Winogradskyella echinorum]MBC3845918.1 heavy-metal-associated domain-containing protein [Winogradskyella echinorum]MBC5750266.1 heavy-metal-associated domain-containing protein [Winogradskyella echinorum]
MKTLKNICIVLTLALVISSCKNESQPEVKTVDVEVSKKDVAYTLDPNATYAKVEFGIDGMTCAMGCAKTIEKKMAKMEGVKSAKVDFDKRLAMVEYDEAKVSPESLEETVTKVADIYKVKDMHKVDSFGAEKKSCKADCDKACCANKTEAEKAACKEDCKKACCNGEKKSE